MELNASFLGCSLDESGLPVVNVRILDRGDDLVVIVDSAAWTARVRYAGPRLREQLQGLGEPVAGKVRVKVGSPPVAAAK